MTLSDLPEYILIYFFILVPVDFWIVASSWLFQLLSLGFQAHV